MSAFIDNLATRIPPSCCPVCQFKDLRVSRLKTENQKIALAFDPRTEDWSLKKLEDIDVEKAIYRRVLPSSAHSIKVQLPAQSKLLADARGSSSRRGTKHQPLLIDGFYITPGRSGTRTTISSTPNDAPGPQQPGPAELPACEPLVWTKQPVELPAEEIPPVTPRAVLQSPPPVLLMPRPLSPRARKLSPLLAPPARFGLLEKRSSGSSVGSGSIQIAYTPSR